VRGKVEILGKNGYFLQKKKKSHSGQVRLKNDCNREVWR